MERNNGFGPQGHSGHGSGFGPNGYGMGPMGPMGPTHPRPHSFGDPRIGDPRMGCERGFCGTPGYGYGPGFGSMGGFGPMGGYHGFSDPRFGYLFSGPFGGRRGRRHWRHKRPAFDVSASSTSSSSSSSSSDSEDEKKDKKKSKKDKKKNMKKKWHKVHKRGWKGCGDCHGVTQCTLCWHQIRPLAETEVLECGHIYHRLCLKELFAISQTEQKSDVFCAQCRQQIDPDLALELRSRFDNTSTGEQTSANHLTRDLKNLKVKE